MKRSTSAQVTKKIKNPKSNSKSCKPIQKKNKNCTSSKDKLKSSAKKQQINGVKSVIRSPAKSLNTYESELNLIDILKQRDLLKKALKINQNWPQNQPKSLLNTPDIHQANNIKSSRFINVYNSKTPEVDLNENIKPEGEGNGILQRSSIPNNMNMNMNVNKRSTNNLYIDDNYIQNQSIRSSSAISDINPNNEIYAKGKDIIAQKLGISNQRVDNRGSANSNSIRITDMSKNLSLKRQTYNEMIQFIDQPQLQGEIQEEEAHEPGYIYEEKLDYIKNRNTLNGNEALQEMKEDKQINEGMNIDQEQKKDSGLFNDLNTSLITTLTKKHQMILENIKAFNSDKEIKCSDHPMEDIQYYCCIDERCICMKCMIENKHINHEIKHIDRAREYVKQRVEKMFIDMKTKIDMLTMNEKKSFCLKNDLCESMQKVKKVIVTNFDELKKVIKEKEEELLKSVDKILNEKICTIESISTKLKNLTMVLNKLYNIMINFQDKALTNSILYCDYFSYKLPIIYDFLNDKNDGNNGGHGDIHDIDGRDGNNNNNNNNDYYNKEEDNELKLDDMMKNTDIIENDSLKNMIMDFNCIKAQIQKQSLVCKVFKQQQKQINIKEFVPLKVSISSKALSPAPIVENLKNQVYEEDMKVNAKNDEEARQNKNMKDEGSNHLQQRYKMLFEAFKGDDTNHQENSLSSREISMENNALKKPLDVRIKSLKKSLTEIGGLNSKALNTQQNSPVKSGFDLFENNNKVILNKSPSANENLAKIASVRMSAMDISKPLQLVSPLPLENLKEKSIGMTKIVSGKENLSQWMNQPNGMNQENIPTKLHSLILGSNKPKDTAFATKPLASKSSLFGSPLNNGIQLGISSPQSISKPYLSSKLNESKKGNSGLAGMNFSVHNHADTRQILSLLERQRFDFNIR